MAAASFLPWRKLLIGSFAFVLVIGAIGTSLIWIAPEQVWQGMILFGRQRANLTAKEVTLPDGRHYAYLDGGEGVPMVLLAGFGNNKDAHLAIAQYLTPHYRVIIPDLLGFGESGHPAQADYSIAGQVAYVHALLASLGVSKYHIGGTSYGAHVTLEYGARYPSETLSLMAIGPLGVKSAKLSQFQIEVNQGRNALLPRSMEEVPHLVELAMVNPPKTPYPLMGAMQAERISNRTSLEEIFNKKQEAAPLETIVNGLKTPTLLVWGEHDRFSDVDAGRILHDLMPNSRLDIIEGVGHSISFENPKRLAKDYLAFLASLK